MMNGDSRSRFTKDELYDIVLSADRYNIIPSWNEYMLKITPISYRPADGRLMSEMIHHVRYIDFDLMYDGHKTIYEYRFSDIYQQVFVCVAPCFIHSYRQVDLSEISDYTETTTDESPVEQNETLQNSSTPIQKVTTTENLSYENFQIQK
jgi:hypothetical protein